MKEEEESPDWGDGNDEDVDEDDFQSVASAETHTTFGGKVRALQRPALPVGGLPSDPMSVWKLLRDGWRFQYMSGKLSGMEKNGTTIPIPDDCPDQIKNFSSNEVKSEVKDEPMVNQETTSVTAAIASADAVMKGEEYPENRPRSKPYEGTLPRNLKDSLLRPGVRILTHKLQGPYNVYVPDLEGEAKKMKKGALDWE